MKLYLGSISTSLFSALCWLYFFHFFPQQKSSCSFCYYGGKREPVLIKAGYFSLKIISAGLHQELEINQEESCKEDLPNTNHEKLLCEHTLWNMLGGILILIRVFQLHKGSFYRTWRSSRIISNPQTAKRLFLSFGLGLHNQRLRWNAGSLISKPSF